MDDELNEQQTVEETAAFSDFPAALAIDAEDAVVGLKSGSNTRFLFSAILAWLQQIFNSLFIPNSQKGANGGVATLNASGQVPGFQLDLSGKQDKITASGILKGNGSGGVTAAQAGTDYGTYSKPSGGIPATDLAGGVIPTVPSAYTSNPEMDGTASPGSSDSWARGDHVHPSDTTKANQAQLATEETGSTASRAYAVGEYFCWNGLFYRVIQPISNGGTFTPGTNCVTDTVGERLGLIRTVLCSTGTSSNPVNTVIPLKNSHTYLVTIQRVGDQYSSFGLIVQSNGTVWKNDLASGGAYSNRYSVSTGTRTLTITAYLSAVVVSIIDFGAYA